MDVATIIIGVTAIQGKVKTRQNVEHHLFWWNICSFREQPTVSQAKNSTTVQITWTEDHIDLVKCVDYFYVQYAPSDAQG